MIPLGAATRSRQPLAPNKMNMLEHGAQEMEVTPPPKQIPAGGDTSSRIAEVAAFMAEAKNIFKQLTQKFAQIEAVVQKVANDLDVVKETIPIIQRRIAEVSERVINMETKEEAQATFAKAMEVKFVEMAAQIAELQATIADPGRHAWGDAAVVNRIRAEMADAGQHMHGGEREATRGGALPPHLDHLLSFMVTYKEGDQSPLPRNITELRGRDLGKAMHDLLTSLGVNGDVRITNVYHLKVEEGRPARIFIHVDSHLDAKDIVVRRKALKGTGVVINDYLTKEEMKLKNLLWPQYKELRDQGVDAYFIRARLYVERVEIPLRTAQTPIVE